MYMLNRLFGKTVFQVADNNLYCCALDELDPATHQPKPGTVVLQIERVSDGTIVTEGEWSAISQTIQRVVNREMYDLHFNLQNTHPVSSHCPYLLTETDLWKANDRTCATTERGLDDYHVIRRCIDEGWSACPLYKKVTQ